MRGLDGGKVPTNGRFRVGSITKTFVSTVVLQLVDEGRLALDDPAGEYNGEKRLEVSVTVGAVDSDDPAVRARLGAAMNKLLVVAACGPANAADQPVLRMAATG